MFIVHIAGHLGKDPETRFTANGLKVTSFSVAVSKRVKDKDETIWVRVTVFGDRFDKMVSFLKKGSGVIVTGKMNPPTTYVDKEGRTQASLEIVAEIIEFSPFGKSERQEGQNGTAQQAQQQGNGYEDSSFAKNNATQYAKPPQAAPYSGHAVGQASEQEHLVDEDSLPF